MSPHHPTLSIVILAYNEAQFIGPCLEAIANQTFPPDEVIVVNNNSTDGTVALAKRYAFVKIINEPVQGMIPARNTGLDLASGDLLARIDADTRLNPDWVERAHTAYDALADTIVGVSGPAYFYDMTITWWRQLAQHLHTWGFFGISYLLLRHHTLFGSNMLLSKKAWQAIRTEVCKDGQEVHEDVDLAIHLHRHGSVRFDTKLLVGISDRPLYEGRQKHWWRLVTWLRTAKKHQGNPQTQNKKKTV